MLDIMVEEIQNMQSTQDTSQIFNQTQSFPIGSVT